MSTLRPLPVLMPILSALFFLSCSGNSDPEEAETDHSMFRDPAGYTLEIPEGWDLSERTSGEGLIRADITANASMGLQVRLTEVSPSNFHLKAEQLLAGYCEDMESHWGGSLHEMERFSPDAGDQALTVRIRSDRENGENWYLQESFVRGGSMLLVFQGGSRWTDREEAMVIFDEIVASSAFDEN